MVEFSEIEKILNDISMELKRSHQRHPIEGVEDLEKKITLVKKKVDGVRDSNMSLQSSVFSINKSQQSPFILVLKLLAKFKAFATLQFET